jgi:hypothetical protein
MEGLTMKGKWFAAGVLAATGVLAWIAPAHAGDTIRLKGVDNTPAQNLADDGRGADTIATRYYGGFGRGFGYGGFGRGFGYGGFGRGFGLGYGYGGFGRGFGLGYGGFGRGFGYGYRGLGLGYGGFGRGFGFGYRSYGLGLGYVLGLGYGLGYGGFGYGGFYPGFGMGFGYGGLYGCSGLSGGVYTLSMPVTSAITSPLVGSPQPPYTDLAPSQGPRNEGTYPYDGGPNIPVPSPQAAPTPPTGTQPRTVPLEGRSVSLPKPATKWTYPAYGETARRISSPAERTYLTKGEKKTNSR